MKTDRPDPETTDRTLAAIRAALDAVESDPTMESGEERYFAVKRDGTLATGGDLRTRTRADARRLAGSGGSVIAIEKTATGYTVGGLRGVFLTTAMNDSRRPPRSAPGKRI